MEAAEDYLEKCANMKVDIEVLERLMEPENLEITLRYTLKYSTRGGSNFSSSSTHQRNGFVANRKRLESQGKNGAQQESGQNEWHDIEYCRSKVRLHPWRGKKAIGSRWKTDEGGVSLSR